MAETTPKGSFKPTGSSQTTPQGPWGGGNKYTQMPTLGKDFVAVPPIKGHTQRGNVNPAGPNKGS